MKLLKCQRCGITSAFPGAISLLSASTIRCPHCGHKDYGYVWMQMERHHRHTAISGETITRLRDLLLAIPEGSDATSTLTTFARKYNLSINTLTRLIRTIESMMEGDEGYVWNAHRFIPVKGNPVELEDLRRLIVDQINTGGQPSTVASTSTDDEAIAVWEEKYTTLQNQYNALMANYSTLITRYTQLDQELSRYKNFYTT